MNHLNKYIYIYIKIPIYEFPIVYENLKKSRKHPPPTFLNPLHKLEIYYDAVYRTNINSTVQKY